MGIVFLQTVETLMQCPFCILRGLMQKFRNYDASLLLICVCSFANSADPDEMPHYAAFHLDHHCLSKHLYASLRIEND